MKITFSGSYDGRNADRIRKRVIGQIESGLRSRDLQELRTHDKGIRYRGTGNFDLALTAERSGPEKVGITGQVNWRELSGLNQVLVNEALVDAGFRTGFVREGGDLRVTAVAERPVEVETPETDDYGDSHGYSMYDFW